LPTLQDAFDEEERSTDSEIDNVLGVIGSIPPMPFSAPEIAASETAPSPPAPALVPPPASGPLALAPAREESGMQPRSEAPRPQGDRVTFDGLAIVRRRQQLMIITAVCVFGAFVLAVAAVLHVIGGR
jgi:hypothetical protein